jgi:hypothetical protein
MHYRNGYRAAVKAAVAADAAFANYTIISAWAQNIDADTLPAFGVATPHEAKTIETHDSSTRVTQLMVVLKVSGGDELEASLDDLSEDVERIVIPTVEKPDVECVLRDTRIELDGGGANRVGSLTMDFAITNWFADPLTS